ncbi:hypothetical protein [Caballeronia calidae]|nr:hypothetical protein [Caballeronia calidae]
MDFPDVDAMTDEEYDAWFRKEVELGLAEADAGNLIPHEQVVREMREHIERRRRERAEKNGLSSSKLHPPSSA